MAVDAKRQRRYLLHYRNGLYVQDWNRPVQFIDLRDLDYLRHLYLDADGTVWLAGTSCCI